MSTINEKQNKCKSKPQTSGIFLTRPKHSTVTFPY